MKFKKGDRVKCYYHNDEPRVSGTFERMSTNYVNNTGDAYVIRVQKVHTVHCPWTIGEELHHLPSQGKIVRLVKKKK